MQTSTCTHNWVQVPKTAVTDGETFRCSKCGITQQKLPADKVENPTESEKEDNKKG